MSLSDLNENRRLSELHRIRILDTDTAPEFEAVVELALSIFSVPTALISFVDGDRQWFKARRGFALPQTPRSQAICNETIKSGDPLIVPDASKDPRFRNNPLVTAPGGIRFYVGVPLALTPDLAIGSLCVIDCVAREPDPAQIEQLLNLARVTVGLIRACSAARTAETARADLDLQGQVLRRRERRFLLTEAMARIGGWELDLASDRMHWTEGMYAIAGLQPGTPITGTQTLDYYLESERPRVSEAVSAAIRFGKPLDGVFEMIAADGSRKWIRHIGETENQDGRATRLYGIAQDVTERHLHAQRLWTAANSDSLTGLANRSRYRTVLGEESRLAVAQNRPLALLIIDVDHLKDINDTLGHEFGDAVILSVADRLSRTCGEDGLVARLGGDEFTVITGKCVDPASLSDLATRLIEAVCEPLDVDGHRVVPSISIGGAIVSGDGLGQDCLRRNADIAVYHAKETRRGGFVLYEDQLRTTITRRMENVRLVSEVLGRGGVVPWYQPVINLSTGHVEGFEALARLSMPDGSLRSAGEFLEAVNDQRIGTRLAEAMFHAVADDLANWRRNGLSIGRIGLNVTLADLVASDLEARLDRIFGGRDIPLSSIVVEVTESAFLNQNATAVAATLDGLRRRGVIVSLDDFGTGFASLTHLLTLPVDTIKIDRSFVHRMTEDRRNDDLVALLIDLGRKLGVDVVAEGIETLAQLDRITELGAGFGQGYLFSRPLPRSAVADFYTAFTPPARRPRRRGGAARAAG